MAILHNSLIRSYLLPKIRQWLSGLRFCYLRIPTLLLCILIPLNLISAAENVSEKTASKAETNIQLEVLFRSIDESIQSEKGTAEDLEVELTQSVQLKKSIAAEMDNYNVQQTTFSNLLYLPQIQIRTLQNAHDMLEISFAILGKRLKELKAQYDTLDKLSVAADDRLVVISSQLSNIKATGNRRVADSINKKLLMLRRLVLQKKTFYRKIYTFYGEQIKQLEISKQSFTESSLEYKKILDEKQSQNLFQQGVSLFSKHWPAHIKKMSAHFYEQSKKLGSRDFWSKELNKIQQTDSYDLFSFFSLLLLVLICCWRLSRFISEIKINAFYLRHPSLHLPLTLLQQGIFQLGIAIYLFFYTWIATRSGMSGLLLLLIDLLIVDLFTGWGLSLVGIPTIKELSSSSFVNRMRRMILFVRWYLFLFLILAWMFEYSLSILLWGRVILELSLIGFSFSLWRTFRLHENTTRRISFPKVTASVILTVAIAGLILETSGFGSLASFWYLSFGRTAVVCLLSALLFSVLKELNTNLNTREKEDSETVNIASYQVRWILIRLFQILGPLFVILALILAWGGKQAILSNTFFVLSYRFQFGDTSFSLLSFFGAILILLATHAFTRLWKYTFQKRFLHRSHMEEGLQESITTITVYVIWVFGLIAALNLFGLNPTSLVVVFGALGIGLGFGLQGIFNNFMSGLILLFERPIQVGDDIEINGTWATVKKINVRSTLVQTYDNASLIIPNSDLINNQVTNWSFKDKSLRRQITVGVAYGSDIELVRKTLLEIGMNTQNVLKYPTPEILFIDFGDSALIFKLRIWTQIEYMLTVETDIRFKIDHVFKDRNISIAYPQRDIHLFVEDKKPEENNK
jgi:potassium-dependent mechanosensitive channel